MRSKENQNENVISDRNVRDKYVGRYDVLEKVKQLLLLPGTDIATTKLIAEYYEVGEKAISSIVLRHPDELESDGMRVVKYNELSSLQYEDLKPAKGKVTFRLSDGSELDFPTRGAKIFPKRAILRVGMLLRDSEIAKEVRTQLLNIEEKASEEVKVQDINEEQRLMLNVGMAYASGNIDAMLKATTEYNAFQNRHIEKLQQDNRGLAGEVLEWNDRAKLNAGVRMLAAVTGIQFSVMWNELYKNLQYKYGICLKQRGKSPYIQYVKSDEWENVVKTFCAMCEAYGQSPSDMFQQCTPVDSLK